MNVNEVSKQLLEALGGKDNIRTNEACMTRLRVGVRDVSLVDVEAIKHLDGVLGVVESDTVQIVFGPGTAHEMLEAFVALTGIAKGSIAASEKPAPVPNPLPEGVGAPVVPRSTGPVRTLLKHIANVFVPLLPGIIAAGLINGITNVINVSTNGAYNTVWWYATIRTMGWALFAYLPIFAGYNSAREFGGSPILGGIAGAICVANTAMPLLAQTDGQSIILPITNAAYNPSNGGLIAALLAGALFALLERKIRKVIPKLVNTFFTPLLVVLIGGIAVVTALQPVGAALTQGIYAVMSFVYDGMGVVGGYLLAATFLPLVSVGLHQAFTPIHAMLNDPSGPTGGINYLLPVLMMSGGGQVGAGIALYVKAKNQKMRGYLRDSIPVGILGVGEPLMYAVTLPLGRPFITACLGAGIGGAVATLFHIGAVSQGVSGLFGLLIVQPGQEIHYVIAMLCSCVGGFVFTWLFGVDDNRIDEVYKS